MASAKTTPGLDEELLQHPYFTTGGLFVEAHKGLEDEMERRLTAEAGVSPQWFDVLMRLARTPGQRLRMSDLAAQTILSASGLTRAVDRMEQAGLVRREACPSDRRGSFAVITDEGLQRLTTAAPAHLRMMTEVLEDIFTGTEIETFTDLLHRLRDRLNPEAAIASDCAQAEGAAER